MSEPQTEAVVIPFPVKGVTAHVVVDDDEPTSWTHEDVVATAEAIGYLDDPFTVLDMGPDDEEVEEPETFVEAEGEWVFVEHGEDPPEWPAVGMVAYDIEQRCRWRQRHVEAGEQMPQACCYSVLVTTKRLPEFHASRHWLAEE